MPIRGYIIHNNFIVILSCEITFIFSGFNLNGRSPTDCIRLEVANSPLECAKKKRKKKKGKKWKDEISACTERIRQKGQSTED